VLRRGVPVARRSPTRFRGGAGPGRGRRAARLGCSTGPARGRRGYRDELGGAPGPTGRGLGLSVALWSIGAQTSRTQVMNACTKGLTVLFRIHIMTTGHGRAGSSTGSTLSEGCPA